MSTQSPNKYAVMTGARSALLANADVIAFTSSIYLIPRDANLSGLNIGRNRMVLLRDGGATRSEESTTSTTWEFTLHIAVIDIGGDANQFAPASRVMAARADVCEVLDRNASVYGSDAQWVEQAHVTDVQEVQKIWSDLFEQAQDTPFVLESAAVKYKIFCQEG